MVVDLFFNIWGFVDLITDMNVHESLRRRGQIP